MEEHQAQVGDDHTSREFFELTACPELVVHLEELLPQSQLRVYLQEEYARLAGQLPSLVLAKQPQRLACLSQSQVVEDQQLVYQVAHLAADLLCLQVEVKSTLVVLQAKLHFSLFKQTHEPATLPAFLLRRQLNFRSNSKTQVNFIADFGDHEEVIST